MKQRNNKRRVRVMLRHRSQSRNILRRNFRMLTMSAAESSRITETHISFLDLGRSLVTSFSWALGSGGSSL